MTWSFRKQLAGVDADRARRDEPWMPPASSIAEQIRHASLSLNVAGATALVLGLMAIAVPAIASVTTTIFVGWILVASGVTIAIHAISHGSLTRGLEALIALVAGLYVLVFPLSGTVTLTFVLAVWFFASGILSLAYARQWSGIHAVWIHALGGVVSVILGFLIAASLPSSAAWVIGLLVGINLVLWALRALIGARLMKDLVSGRTRPLA